MSGNMERIRKWYGVPAKRGGRVAYTRNGHREFGTIRGACSNYLKIQLDGRKNVSFFHPTWCIEYL